VLRRRLRRRRFRFAPSPAAPPLRNTGIAPPMAE